MRKSFIAMATLAIMVSATFVSCNSQAQEKESKEMSVKEALMQRHSVRNYSDAAISDEMVLDILWAANGVSREDGKRTAPSAINAQDIDLYVCNAEGAFKYDPKNARLEKVTDEDIRPFLKAQNRFVDTTPLTILLVTDQSKFGEPRPGSHNMNFGLIDAGIVSENISLYCTALGLGTVCCAPRIQTEEIARALGLSEQEIPVLYHPIGHPAE